MTTCQCKSTPLSPFPTSLAGANDTCDRTFAPPGIQPVGNAWDIVPRIGLNQMSLRFDMRGAPVTTDVGGCAQGWISTNARTFDAPRAIQTVLDRPPYTGRVNVGNVCHDEIYTPAFGAIGKNATNYLTMDGGSIQYYLDPTDVHPYDNPNYPTPAMVTNKLYVDPMGETKPEYERFPMTAYSWNKPYDSCDSFTHDTLEFRQDLMARQSRRMNQQRWEYRYGPQVLAAIQPCKFKSTAQ